MTEIAADKPLFSESEVLPCKLESLCIATTRLHGFCWEPLPRVLAGEAHIRFQQFGKKGGFLRAMLTILVLIPLLLALGALPTWPYGQGWGYDPSGGLGRVVLILVILFLGRI